MSGQSRRRVAILVGNCCFDAGSGLNQLQFPRNDVLGMRDVLIDDKIGRYDRVECFLEESSSNLLDAVEDILVQERGSDFLFFYSGHGVPSDGGKLYLATNNTLLTHLHARAIPFHLILEMMADHGVRSFAAILDCCFAGLAVEGFKSGSTHQVWSLAEQQIKSISNSKGIYFLGATSATTIAKELTSLAHGALTAGIIEGLRGGLADVDRDGRITGPNLFEWCKQYAKNNDIHPPVQCTNVTNDDITIAFSDNFFTENDFGERYNSAYDPDFTKWMKYLSESFPGFKADQKIYCQTIDDRRASVLKTGSPMPIGLNINIENSIGIVSFSYIIYESTGQNVSFVLIPMRYGDRLASNRRNHGREIIDKSSDGDLKSRRIIFRPEKLNTKWQNAKMSFDFSSLGSDVFVVFGARINEATTLKGAGCAAISDTKIFVKK